MSASGDSGLPNALVSGIELREAIGSMLEPLSIMQAVRDEDGRIIDFEWTYINEAGAQANLIPSEELIGQRLLEKLPEHRDGLFHVYVNVVNTGEPFVGVELGYDDTWGTTEVIPRIFNIRATKVGDGFAVSWNDVTDQVQVRHDVVTASRRLEVYQQIVERAGQGIWVFSADGNASYANDSMAHMLGVEPADLVGKPMSVFLSAANKRLAAAMLSRQAAGRAHLLDLCLQHADGHDVYVQLSITSMDPALGARGGTIALVRDVTAERVLADAKERIVGIVSHELRNPLGAIRGALEMLIDGDFGTLPPEALRPLDVMQRNADQMLRIANDLIDLDRLDSGMLPLELMSVEVGKIVHSVVESTSTLGAQRGITITGESEAALITADPQRMEQVLTNLIGNAIKFSPDEGIVAVKAIADRHKVRIAVMDQGRGIPQQRIDSIFERYAQVEADDSLIHGGAGLGLAIAKGIVEQHGGTIIASSAPGMGSTFTVSLPLAPWPAGSAYLS